MTEADHIAIGIKATISALRQTGAVPECVVLDVNSFHIVSHNEDPCDPPDFDDVNQLFCGLPLLIAGSAKFHDKKLQVVGVRNLWQPPANTSAAMAVTEGDKLPALDVNPPPPPPQPMTNTMLFGKTSDVRGSYKDVCIQGPVPHAERIFVPTPPRKD